MPPIASALLPIRLLDSPPSLNPVIVTTQATAPIIDPASAVFTFKKAEDRPTAKASILAAIDSVIGGGPS
jgi:hypothetical protein